MRKGLRCNKCDTTIVSRSVHDFRSCKCKDISVDGGSDYFRYGWSEGADFEEVEVDD